MRRSIGGLVLIVGAVLIALAIGAWWLQRVAFTPADDSGVALSILGDEDIRGQIATIVASADAPTLQQSPPQLKEFIEEIARIPDGAALMSRFVAEGHARLLGETDELVLITAEEQVTIVRDERVGEADSLTLPVQRVGSMAFLNDWLGWFALGAGALGLLIVLIGVILRPERGEGTFALGVGLASLAGSLVLFGYLVPLAVLPAFSDDPWMGLMPRLANHHRNLTLLLAVVALVVAALIVFATSSRRQRRQHSTPLNVGRYRDDRSWSR
ncbi:MAG: hypothetical protein WBL31_14130 [Ilumatobacteraceae bacterium]